VDPGYARAVGNASDFVEVRGSGGEHQRAVEASATTGAVGKAAGASAASQPLIGRGKPAGPEPPPLRVVALEACALVRSRGQFVKAIGELDATQYSFEAPRRARLARIQARHAPGSADTVDEVSACGRAAGRRANP